jgi:hypothetical protein
VEDRNDLLVSESVSEMKELRRRLSTGCPSAKVDARPNGRCLKPFGDGLTCRPEDVGGGKVIEVGLSVAISAFSSSRPKRWIGRRKIKVRMEDSGVGGPGDESEHFDSWCGAQAMAPQHEIL